MACSIEFVKGTKEASKAAQEEYKQMQREWAIRAKEIGITVEEYLESLYELGIEL